MPNFVVENPHGLEIHSGIYYKCKYQELSLEDNEVIYETEPLYIKCIYAVSNEFGPPSSWYHSDMESPIPDDYYGNDMKVRVILTSIPPLMSDIPGWAEYLKAQLVRRKPLRILNA